MTEPAMSSGQAAGPEGATQAAPVNQSGQSSPSQTSASPAEETFFDPKSIEGKPELQSLYKQMQGAYTKKTQALAANRQKIEAYERFEKNPVESLKAIAKQYGVKILEGEAPKDFNPQSWDEVLTAAEQKARDKVMDELSPYLNQVREIRKQNIEAQLNEIDPNWKLYEDQMAENLNKHHSLAADPEMLYRISVPPEVIEKRAMQQALEKLKGKQEPTPSGGSKTFKQPTEQPGKKLNFDEAYQRARSQLISEGYKPGL